ncbi:biopolymer transporter ExbB [Ponticoccus sp. SC2-23]|uniref:biopolymer transporter ExbB n=1 Tax=Alexandriicola marinus TaxID=2081710 RepID=UPI000FD72C8B|nr:biopolymer transporter ExbB [Alexandriicola marinus]MBM1220091.1 biopolymer transporter ExbB [Ponticoccus sp. SC6-9]MBM1224777.1 biopolymer transporter ExbB [Ponticoccus sp. SC6-15]MBM1228290.1 biopolymer transporter ExbB [Ponticoccus sp. SC6-38]MBM1234072.1 biopolymer transporter ExbB [Ponticoccus sp. SC6-45]MBM1238792.1 biopolymer transporter ExbB [Ponticoccus sp. SC6-49]MBM1242573.1 biopolymer transporter ExbB [Ponticoccus sp. SC2-64]MBM1247596.1 biopolymer transporter ExbB [Ponticoccu
MEAPEVETRPQFTQPVRQLTSMLVVIALVGAGLYFGFDTIRGIFEANPYLNSVIASVFVLGVLSCFRQVIQLGRSVNWIEGFASQNPGHEMVKAPGLLAPLATLLRSRGARMQLSASSSRSILDSVAQRIDEDREITRYLGNVLIFLGLLGTFYGLATTVPALVDTIRGLNPQEGESGTAVFSRLQAGLEAQLGGMGTAFSSSLLGLAGSLVVGLLELFATHGQNRFYRELEEWLSTITRVGFSSGDEGVGSETAAFGGVIDNLAEQMEALQVMFTQTDIARSEVDGKLGELATAITDLSRRMESSDTSAALMRIAESQEKLINRLGDVGEGIDPESRMRLRSIDVQMLRILEELSAGRQEAVADLKSELSSLSRALRQSKPRPTRPLHPGTEPPREQSGG